jgi:hypothetical protein
MSSSRRDAGRSNRLLWGGIGVLLLLMLGASFLMSRRALDTAEADAELAAQRDAVAISSELTPEMVQDDILGPDYRELLAIVQAEVLVDEDVVWVRIWKPDGDLIFSTAAQDSVEEFVAVDDPQIEAASGGETVSVVLESTAAPLNGLEGADEDLFVTYTPLRFPNDPEPAGVIEIAQRYASIVQEANAIWRPVQIGIVVALVAVGVLFAITQRAAARRSRWTPAKAPRVTKDERQLKDAEDRAIAAERAAREVEQRLADAERRVEELSRAEVPPEIRARLEELEVKLRAEVAEREQAAAEAKRARTALSEKEAELALLREGTATNEAEKVRSFDAAARAERQTADAEQRAAAAGNLAANAEARAAEAEAKTALVEAQLQNAEHRMAAAVAEARREAERARADEDARSAAELRTPPREANDLKLALAETQAALQEAEARRASAEGALPELDRVREEANAMRSELEVARLELQRTKLELETSRDEVETSMSEVTSSRAEIAATRMELERETTELEQMKSELERTQGELGRTAAALAMASNDSEPLRAELERVRAEQEPMRAELERARAEQQELRAEADRLRSELAPLHAELERTRASEEPLRSELESSRSELEPVLAELERVRAEQEPMRVELDRARAELDGARSELDRMRGELERAVVDRGGPEQAGGGESAEELTRLRALATQMETQRREEIVELQRSQEALANTQVELMDSTRKLRAAEDRVRELESAAGVQSSRGVPVYEPSQAEAEAPPARPARPARRPPAAEPAAEPEPQEAVAEEEPQAEEPPEEALSLRERLARAAAARHRTSQPPE